MHIRTCDICRRVKIRRGKKRTKNIQGLYSFDTGVLPKTGYPAIVLCVDVSTPPGEGNGEEGGGGRGGGGGGRLRVGRGSG